MNWVHGVAAKPAAQPNVRWIQSAAIEVPHEPIANRGDPSAVRVAR